MKKKSLNQLFLRYSALESCRVDIEAACQAVIHSYKQDGKLLVCGNGGSAADADHIVGELMKSFEKKRPLDKKIQKTLTAEDPERGTYIAGKLQQGLPAISLNAQAALLSAVANDIDASLVYAQQVAGYGKTGDVLVAISTSGNSRNVLDAAITAKAMGLTVIGLTGQIGGKLKQYCDVTICVPATRTAEVQEYHLPVYHAICLVVEEEFFEENPKS